MEVHRILEGVKARDIMATDCQSITGDLTLEELVERYVLPSGNRCFVVTENGTLRGMVSLHEIKVVPREQWSHTRVREMMKPVEHLKIAAPDTDIERILSLMDEEKVNQMPVVDRQQLVGMITRERLLNIIRTRIALSE